MASLALLDWLIFGGYVLTVFALGVWFARGQRSNEDYFLGGRKMNWFAVGLSLFAGTFSSLSFVGLPRRAAYDDYHLYLSILFIPFVAGPLLWFFMVPLYYRLGSPSVYEYLQRRFGRGVRRIASLFFMAYQIGWMGNMLVAVGVILQAVLDLSPGQMAFSLVVLGLFATLYTSMGGVKAVVWTDVLQAVTLGGGMVYILFLGVSRIDGGWSTVWEVAQRDDKFAMVNLQFGFAEESSLFAVVAFGLFVYVGGHLTSFGAVQRYVSMPSVAAARSSLIVNGVMVAAVCGLFFFVGTVVYVYFQQPPESGLPNFSGPERDRILPYFIQHVLATPGLNGLLLAALFAAAMSSVDSGINSLTATLVYDWLDGRDVHVAFSRRLCAIFGVAVTLSALVISNLGKGVFPMIMRISGLTLGPIFGIFLLGWLVPWANAPGTAVGALASVVTMAYIMIWHSDGVSESWYGAFACVPTFVVGTIASLLFPRPRDEQLSGLCIRSRAD